MKIELTPDEVRTILAALSVYQDAKEDAWLSQGWSSDQEEAGSAKWVWQKIVMVKISWVWLVLTEP